MQFFMSFYEGQLKHQICYNFILLIFHMVFNPFRVTSQFFYTASVMLGLVTFMQSAVAQLVEC